MNLHNIRLYGHEWESSYFRRKGLRGWWLRTLNALRYWIELKVQWHTLYILSKIAGADLDAMRTQFERDTRKVHDIWKEERGSQALTGASAEELFDKPEKTAEQKTVEMLARLSEITRAKRYAHNRRTFQVFEVADEEHVHAKAGAIAAAASGSLDAGGGEGEVPGHRPRPANASRPQDVGHDGAAPRRTRRGHGGPHVSPEDAGSGTAAASGAR